ncbi:unnamed protein product [Protopolystoma xenopodis]|uniref:Uncharacterized protein n=1 Tax=Protopolystoma xenopodis TaxID=117903 RepID=A0A3S5BSL0_9PLAT|nr:unnamed protein product [Protopolystoma xenopodis]
MMDESSARFHPKRWRTSRGLRQPERRNKAKRLQYNAIQPSSSGEIALRISSSCTFIRNESVFNHAIIRKTTSFDAIQSRVQLCPASSQL